MNDYQRGVIAGLSMAYLVVCIQQLKSVEKTHQFIEIEIPKKKWWHLW